MLQEANAIATDLNLANGLEQAAPSVLTFSAEGG